MQKQDNINQKYILIDHCEDYLFEWCSEEYQQILKYLKNSKQFKLILSNYKKIQDFKSTEDEEKDNRKNLDNLLNHNNKQEVKFEMVYNDVNNEQNFNEKSELILRTLENKNLKFETNRVCLLDLRGTEVLKPSDAQNFDLFIFGGILGDHPPKDRTKQLRNAKFQMRHLENVQLSTDTAVLVSKLIIENQRPFSSLPFVDEPSVSVTNSDNQIEQQFQLEGFRYLKDVYDYEKADIDDTKKTEDFLMNHNIRNSMLTMDLDFNLF